MPTPPFSDTYTSGWNAAHLGLNPLLSTKPQEYIDGFNGYLNAPLEDKIAMRNDYLDFTNEEELING